MSFNRGGQDKMRSLGWTLSQHDRYPYKRGEFGNRNRRAHEENATEDDGRDWGDVSTSQEVPNDCWHTPRSKEEERVYSESQGTTALLTPWLHTFSLQNCEAIHFKAPICGTLFQQPWETNKATFTNKPIVIIDVSIFWNLRAYTPSSK